MSFVTRFAGTLTLSLGFLAACSGDSGSNFGQPSAGGKTSAGGGDNDASTGGATGGKGNATGGGGNATGGHANTGGSTGGDGGDASTVPPDASAGGTDSGTGGAGGAAAGAGGAGGKAGAGGGGGAGGTGPKKPNGQACTAGTQCTSGNCVGSVCCAVACNTPGLCQQLTGTQCVTTPSGTTCDYGSAPDESDCDDGDPCTTVTKCKLGVCEVRTPKDCNDKNPCTDDACNSAGTCTHTTTNCDDKNPCTTDTCGANGCVHSDATTPTPAGGCNDNNPCTTDSCSGGLCVHAPKDCSLLDDDCNKGVCNTSGVCAAQPANASGPCAMSLTSCDTAGTCNASGACVGDQDACGSLATGCTSCGASCHTCTCPANTVSSGGVCVPQTNECALSPSPCVAIATCRDPSSTSGDVVCTCPKGYTGNGKTAAAGGNGCTDIDECSGTNPCGAGTCVNTPGSYTCTCGTGLKMVTTATGQKCVCDLGGTYGLVVTSNVTFTSPNPAIEASPPGGVTIYSWTLRYNTISANGTMTSQTIPCGGSSPTLCDTAFGFAHAQFQPTSTWGKKKVNDGFAPFSMSLVGVVPGAAASAYKEPTTYSLQGITLDDPAGEWPPCAACVGVNVGSTCTCSGTQHTVTNKATWVDADSDTHLGFTTETVPRGGQLIGSPYSIDGSTANPQWDYTEPSECPRTTAGTKYNYAEFPGIVGILPFRAYRWYAAGRVIGAYVGSSVTLASNKCEIDGNVTGPDSGKPHGDARVQGCETCSAADANTCTPGGPCSPAQASSYDEVQQNQTFASTTFKMTNVTSTIDLSTVMSMADGAAKEAALNQACQQLRQQNCPSGKSCN